MRASTIQLFISDIIEPTSIELKPKILNIEVADIQQIIAEKKRYRVYKAPELPDAIRERLIKRDDGLGFISVFGEEPYEKLYKLHESFSLDMKRNNLCMIKKLSVSKLRIFPHEYPDVDLKEPLAIPYYDMGCGSIIVMKNEKHLRHVICHKERLASNVFTCLMNNKDGF